jgi:hypothetical protein
MTKVPVVDLELQQRYQMKENMHVELEQDGQVLRGKILSFNVPTSNKP